ncbi:MULTISPECIES: hypothetical protein [unclassified Marinovum]|uniref:hypothetical protein n=1 Tax=unclassified Marinovum TaxID=2647166 RepID=UPI0026E1C9C8|nr:MULTISPECIES: hypothetical protein [unclassified Marinovum]
MPPQVLAYAVGDCSEKATNLKLGKRAEAFLKIFEAVHREYQSRLGDRIDFEDMLSHHRPFTRRLRRQLLELRNLLFLEYAYNDDWGDGPDLALLEPDDPIVPEICLLADGLEQALQDAGVFKSDTDQTA